jgi:lysophospholipase L1-like esterase
MGKSSFADQLQPDQLAYLIQFQHPQRMLARMPGMCDELVAIMFGIEPGQYRSIRDSFAEKARAAAADLLRDPAFSERVDCLPFEPGQTVIGLGDSITDDFQSWLEILRNLVEIRRPGDRISVVNAGISGDTTTHTISRFLDVVTQKPAWIVCMVGTNDARQHGMSPTKILVSIDETEENMRMLRSFAATQTSARWVWMTPATVIEEKIAQHWFLGSFQRMRRNRDLAAIAEVVRAQPEAKVELYDLFGVPARADWLLEDGLHPSLEGQKAIVKALVETLTQ